MSKVNDASYSNSPPSLWEGLNAQPITNAIPTNSSAFNSPLPVPPNAKNGSVSVPKVAAISAAIIFLGLGIIGFIFYLFWVLRKRRNKGRKERKRQSKLNTYACEGSCYGTPAFDYSRDQLSERDIESISKRTKSTCDSCSSRAPSMTSFAARRKDSIAVPSPLAMCTTTSSPRRTLRPLSALHVVTNLTRTDEEEMLRNGEKQRTSVFNHALLNSPIVEKVLTEAYDFKRGDGKKEEAFDWKHCDFEDVEEEAMWLPSQPNSATTTPSGKDTVGQGGDSRSNAVASSSKVIIGASQMHPLQPHLQRRSSPAYFDLDRSNLSTTPASAHNLSPHLPNSPSSNMYSPSLSQMSQSPHLRSQSSRSRLWNSNGNDSMEDLDDGTHHRRPSLLRHSISTSSVFLSPAASFSDPFAEARLAKVVTRPLSIKSECMLRPTSTPPLLVRAVQSPKKTDDAFSPTSGTLLDSQNLVLKIREIGTSIRPSTTDAIHFGNITSPEVDENSEVDRREASQRRRPATTDSMVSCNLTSRRDAGHSLQLHRFGRRGAISPQPSVAIHCATTTTANVKYGWLMPSSPTSSGLSEQFHSIDGASPPHLQAWQSRDNAIVSP